MIIYKTPLEIAYSRFKRDNLKGWKRGWIKVHQRLFAILDDFVTVKYQELAKDPESKLKELCDYLDIKYFEGKEKFWNNKAEHFLFGSDTVRYSKKLVYYEEQYDEEKLEELKRKIKIDDLILQNLMTVLDAYEVKKKDETPSDISNMKISLSDFKTFYRLRLRAENTRYYSINKSMIGLKDKIKSVF